MKLNALSDDTAILRELGERIRQHRIAMELTQEDLAQKSGISLSTLKRIENGEDSKFSNIIKLLKEMNLADNFELLIPDTETNFKAVFENKPQRKRVRTQNKPASPTWVWGDDQ